MITKNPTTLKEFLRSQNSDLKEGWIDEDDRIQQTGRVEPPVTITERMEEEEARREENEKIRAEYPTQSQMGIISWRLGKLGITPNTEWNAVVAGPITDYPFSPCEVAEIFKSLETGEIPPSMQKFIENDNDGDDDGNGGSKPSPPDEKPVGSKPAKTVSPQKSAMQNAWRIRREAALRFGCRVGEVCWSSCLRLAWKQAKQTAAKAA